MVYETRLPEGREVNQKTVKLFSRIAALGALPAAWRVKMILGDKLGASAHVLDIGTGPGTIPLHLKKFFPEASFTGLDVSPDMLTEAMKHSRRQRKNLNLLAGDGTLLPFADNSLDGVLSFFTLHHIDTPAPFFKEVNRVLKPDGFFLLIDFRRDMQPMLYRLMNAAWQTSFFFTSGKKGFKESVASAWRPEEINQFLSQAEVERFTVHTSKTELIIT